jgi:Tol biopolymer transport system component
MRSSKEVPARDAPSLPLDPGPPNLPASRARRAAISFFALAVAAAGISFVVRAFEPAGPAHEAAASAPMDPGKIAFTMGDPGRVYVADPDGTNVQRLTTGDEEGALTERYSYADDFDVTWSPDGSTIAFMRWYDGQSGSVISLCSVVIDGSGFRVILRDFDGVQLAWSPDGTSLAYYGSKDQTIHIVDVNGTNDRPLSIALAQVPGDPPAWLPAWSPDGTRIAFTSRDLWTIGIDGTGLTQLTHLTGDVAAFGAAWSPDGSMIAFSLGRWFTDGGTGGAQTGGDIYVVSPDGLGLKSLTGTDRSENLPPPSLDSTGSPLSQGGWTSPTWSPDGSEIALGGAGLDFGKMGLYVMDANGADLHEIFDAGGGLVWHSAPAGSTSYPSASSPRSPGATGA